MSLQVDVQSACSEPVPDEDDIRGWLAAALCGQSVPAAAEISVRLVNTSEMAGLNKTYRGKAGPTNVLSFPAELPEELGLPLLGDIIICAAVVAAEAQQQGKSLSAHWAHMTIHGALHLLGYDHQGEEDAAIMEALESDILSGLGFPCPYLSEPGQERAAG
jgi:probable rRNA maturation factor